MRRLLTLLLTAAAVGFAVFLWVTRADTLPDDAMAGLEGDAAAGELVFTAGGCNSCHAAPNAAGEDKDVLSGGKRFASDFGTFIAPNISPDPEHGIGGWSALDLANAMTRGVSPEGQHYYPAFPFASYNKVSLQEVADLRAFLDTLPPSATPSQPHEVGFPFSIRRAVGGWKFLFMDDDWVMQSVPTPELERGRHIVEALAHCGECHTPRNALGAMNRSAWLSGAPNPSGEGTIPDITPKGLTWSEGDLVAYFTDGFTPEFDTAGGSMVDVVENLAKLPQSDREAVAAYLKALPAE